MITIGIVQKLKVIQKLGQEIYLGSGASGKILLTDRQLDSSIQIGDNLDVFVFVDAQGHLAATTQIPKAQVGEVAWLPVVSINNVGVFLDWGLPKDLLVPFSEQYEEMEVGKSYLVKIYCDAQNRLAATAKLDKHLAEKSVYFKAGQKVSLIIADKTVLGYKTIVNDSHWGLLYHNELYQPVSKGQRLEGYIKQIREDHKIDLCLQPPGYEKVLSVTEEIIAKLRNNNGVLLVNDDSSPALIHQTFGISKKVFKQAIGALYKKKLISIETSGIKLIQKAK